MSEITVDQKLKLVNQIRQEQQQNTMAMKNRERILYGEGNLPVLNTPSNFLEDISTVPNENTGLKSTLGLRFLIALLLFSGYIGLWKSNTSIGILDSTKILYEVNRYSEINANLFDFMNNFTYTLNTD